MSKRPETTHRRPSSTDPEDGDPFLSRWARRKRVARSGGDPDARDDQPARDIEARQSIAPVIGEASPQGDDEQAEALTDDDMPPLDAIDENTDMSGFFSPKVSQAVKKAALRKFFHSSAFNFVDGLDDYDDDFTNFPSLGDIITSDMRGQMEREAERAKQALAKDAEPGGEHGADDRLDETPAAESRGAADETSETASLEPAEAQPGEAEPRAPGVTRDRRVYAATGPGKLRPRARTDDGDGDRPDDRPDDRGDDRT